MNNIIALLAPIVIAIFGSSGFWAFMTTKKDKSTDILNEIKGLSARIDKLEKVNEEKDALNWRNQIVNFSDSLRAGNKHSRDAFDHTLIIVDKYLDFCSKNEWFKNSIAEVSIKKIKQHYEADDFM